MYIRIKLLDITTQLINHNGGEGRKMKWTLDDGHEIYIDAVRCAPDGTRTLVFWPTMQLRDSDRQKLETELSEKFGRKVVVMPSYLTSQTGAAVRNYDLSCMRDRIQSLDERLSREIIAWKIISLSNAIVLILHSIRFILG
nr:MAG TPA: hypothetical protein [Caudoviricetes sp.]